MTNSQKTAASPAAPPGGPAGVRFLLQELLEELEIERAMGTHGLEKLDRKEIRKLLKEKGDRRVRSSK
jgi:hypothetical protein